MRRLTAVIALALLTAAARPGSVTVSQTPSSSKPVSVVLVLDTSASVRLGRIEYPQRVRLQAENFRHLRAAAGLVVRALHAGDEVALLTFGDRLTLSVAPTTDFRLVTAALEALLATTAAVRSMVWDATLAGAAIVAGRSGRPLVVLLSDGTDNASWHSQDAVIGSLQDLGVPVDLIAVPRTYDSDDPDPPGSWDPRKVAARTGGEVFAARDEQVAARIQDRFARLRAASLAVAGQRWWR